ncbi:MAG: PAS and helix-turn-helix domain-containing protein [Planctomycetota bacterium]
MKTQESVETNTGSVLSDLNPADLLSALVSEPSTGISICRLSGELMYANDQAARIFIGRDAQATAFVGRSLWDVFPAEWMRERVDIGSKLHTTGKPVLVRTIWHGYQVLSWVYPLDIGGEASHARMLIISRRASSSADIATHLDGDVEVIESDVMRLGELDALSPREVEVLALVGQGLSIREIAGTLSRSEKTIQNHRDSIGAKLGLSNRVKVADMARRAALTQRDAKRVRV